MNLLATIQGIIPKAASPRSEVGGIVAGVAKAPELIEAERELAENAAAKQATTKRLAEIFERLNIKSPVRRTLFAQEQYALEAEQSDITRQVDDLNRKASELRRQVDGLKPAYAQAVAVALAGFRHRAAETLLDSIGAVEEAITDIAETSKALLSVGISVPSATPLHYAKALRNLADKILTENLHG
jgi:hypothetical protein